MNMPLSPSSAFSSASRLRALCLAAGLTAAATITGFAQVPPAMQRDFTTAIGSVPMHYDPSGYWYSPPGRAKGSASDLKEALDRYNQAERGRSRIPAGYTFAVGRNGEYIASPSGKSLPVPPAQPVKATKTKAPSPTYSATQPSPNAPKVIYSNGPMVKGKPVPIPPMPSAERPAYVADAPVPKALPYKPADKPAPDAPPPAPKPAARVGPRLVDDAVPTAPIPLPAAKPAIADTKPIGGDLNGIPGNLQKSYLSRNKSVFMIYDKDKGMWTSSVGAVKEVEAADDWCKEATTMDRAYGRIPANFSYRHLGNGQVQAAKN